MAQIDDDILFSTTSEQLALMAAGEISPVELTEGYLARIEKENGALRGFATVTAERAMDQARLAERAYAGKDEHALLLGAPLGVKDIIETAGVLTTYGSLVFKDNVPSEDAETVSRLAAAGAVFLGKTNTFEFALTTPSPLHKGSLNPWARKRVAGGSSNGSGTSVSAALCSAALGTDTGGSVRNPASYVGIVGLKPTHGRVSIRGVGCLAWSMDTVGPMCRSVADAALLLKALAGYDPLDPDCADRPVPDYVAALETPRKGARIGVPREFFHDRMRPEVFDAWLHAQSLLEGQGAHIVPVDLPDLSNVLQIWGTLMGGENNVWHAPTFEKKYDDYGSAPRDIVFPLRTMLATDYVRARRAKVMLARAMAQSMANVDVLLVPSTPTPAFTFEEAKSAVICGDQSLDIGFATTGFTMPFNVTGQPALAVPCGLSPDGLPLSVQIVGRSFDEETVLQVGRLLEEAAEWNVRPPEWRRVSA